MTLKRVTLLSLTLSLLFHLLFLIYSPRIVVGGREKLRNMTERIVQVKLSSCSTLFSQDIKEKPLPVDKGVEVSFKPLDWQRKEFLSLPEPQTPMSEILPPPEKKFSQEVIALSSKLLEEKTALKPRRYISKEEGSTPFSDIGIKLPGEDGEKRFTLKEKIQRKIDLEKEVPVTSLPPSSPLSLPSLTLPVEKISPYAFWDDLLNVKFFIWSPPKQSKYLKVEIGLKPGVKVNPLPREVIFLLDASKSISQKKWFAFTKAVKLALSLLDSQDTFNIVVFRERSFPFSRSSLPVSPRTIKEAEKFLDRFLPEGETDIYNALSPFLHSTDGRVRQIFLFTDGRPTVGITSNRELLSRIHGGVSNVSLFTFGMGQKVNLWILDLMAHRLRGDSFYRSYENKFVHDFPSFFNMYRNPVLTKITYRFSGVSDVYPVYSPHLYKDGKIILLGRIKPEVKEIVFRMRGVTRKGKKEILYRYSLSSRVNIDRNLGETWARFRIHDLLVRMITQKKVEHAGEIVSLMEKYGIRLPYLEELWKRE